MAFEDNRNQVKQALSRAVEAYLEEAGGELQAQTVKNSRTDFGQTKGSYQYAMDRSEGACYVGSQLENAIWEEFGTGDYAIQGGRKTSWYVPVEGYRGTKKPTFQGKVVVVYGKNGKAYYKTNGKKPNRPLQRAFEEKKGMLQKRLEEILSQTFGE